MHLFCCCLQAQPPLLKFGYHYRKLSLLQYLHVTPTKHLATVTKLFRTFGAEITPSHVTTNINQQPLSNLDQSNMPCQPQKLGINQIMTFFRLLAFGVGGGG